MSRTRPVAGLLGQDGPSVELPPWAAAWLETHTNLPEVRRQVRGRDPGLDHVLSLIRYAASADERFGTGVGAAVGAVNGTKGAPLQGETASSGASLLEVEAAAERLGLTSRAVRRAIAEGRLPATRYGREWRIDEADLSGYRSNRRDREATA